MADELKLSGKVVLDDSGAQTSIKSIKQQLKEANAELIRVSETFGETSAEAIQAAKNVAQLKDKIGDAKALTEAFSPDKKFQAFSQAINGVVGGFAALQGAQALFGVKSEELEKTLLKVQGAMALSQGLSAVTESIDAFKNLGTIIKQTTAFQAVYNTATKVATSIQTAFGISVDATSTSFKVLRGALISTGIGALVVAIGFAIEKIVEWTSSTDKQKSAEETLKQAEKDLEEQIKKTNDAIANRNNLSDYELKKALNNAKAKGASITELRKIEDDYYYNKRLQAQIDEENAIKETERIKQQYGENSEIYKTQLEQQNKLSQDKYKINQDYQILESQRRADDYSQQEAERKKQIDNQKQESDKQRQERLQAEEDLQKQLKEVKDANYLQAIKDDQEHAEEKLRIEYENQKKSIEQSLASEEIKNSLLAELGKKYWMDLAIIEEDAKKKQEEKNLANRQREIDFENGTFNILNQNRINNLTNQYQKEYEQEAQAYQNKIDLALEALNNKEITEAQYNARRRALTQEHETNLTNIEKKASVEKVKNAEEEAKARVDLTKSIGDALGQLSEIIGKETAVGKGLAVAQATINTWLGVTEVLKQKSVLPEPAATISKVVNVATIVASGINAVKNILKTKVQGASGGGGSVAGVGTIASTTAPLTPQAVTTTLNQQQVNQLSNVATRAFVLESDVTSNQERIIRLNRAARIN